MKKLTRGYSLIELIVAVGLFALVMTLASGAYLVMINANQQTQSIATGINNLSFALETMTRTIRTGTGYSCNSAGDCNDGTTFTVTNTNGNSITYGIAPSPSRNNYIYQSLNGGPNISITDPLSVNVSSLKFYASGTTPGDSIQPYVTIVVSGTVSSGEGKPPQDFVVETSAVMRGTDL